jgi:hypothetical protein
MHIPNKGTVTGANYLVEEVDIFIIDRSTDMLALFLIREDIVKRVSTVLYRVLKNNEFNFKS